MSAEGRGREEQGLAAALGRLRREARGRPEFAAAEAVKALARCALADADAAGLQEARAAVRGLVEVILRVGAEDGGLEALWAAFEAEPDGALAPLADAWGRLCGDPARAQRWAERLLPAVRERWLAGEDAPASRACLGALLEAGRPGEVLALLAERPVGLWPERRFGVLAWAALGDVDRALAYAADSNPLGHAYEPEIAATCEAVLLAAGRREQAYRDYAFAANTRQNCLLSFRALVRRYPERAPAEVLSDLIEASPGQEGRWFATARALEFFELARELAERAPCDPRTLNRAARERLAVDPRFCLEIAIASLRSIADDHGFAIDGQDVYEAYDLVIQAAGLLGVEADAAARVQALCLANRPSSAWIHSLLADEPGAPST